MATYANIFVDQGADFETTLIVEESSGDLLDLTDLDLSGQIRRTYTSETSYDFDIIVDDPESGEIVLKLNSSVTSNMNRGRYVYDVFASYNGDDKFKVIEGILEIVPRVTR